MRAEEELKKKEIEDKKLLEDKKYQDNIKNQDLILKDFYDKKAKEAEKESIAQNKKQQKELIAYKDETEPGWIDAYDEQIERFNKFLAHMYDTMKDLLSKKKIAMLSFHFFIENINSLYNKYIIIKQEIDKYPLAKFYKINYDDKKRSIFNYKNKIYYDYDDMLKKVYDHIENKTEVIPVGNMDQKITEPQKKKNLNDENIEQPKNYNEEEINKINNDIQKLNNNIQNLDDIYNEYTKD
jgi:hypothetical protein